MESLCVAQRRSLDILAVDRFRNTFTGRAKMVKVTPILNNKCKLLTINFLFIVLLCQGNIKLAIMSYFVLYCKLITKLQVRNSYLLVILLK